MWRAIYVSWGTLVVILIALALSLLATLIPTIIYALTLRWFDRYEKEPLPLVIAAFLWGAIPAVILSAVGEFAADVPLSLFSTSAAKLLGTTGVAPFAEELAKGIFIYVVYLAFQREFDGPIDGIVYGALVGYGFAMTENWFYFLGAWFEGGWAKWSVLVVMRQFLFGMNHAFFTSLTGLGLGLARVSAPAWARFVFALAGLGAAMLFHSIHNLGAALAQTNGLTFVIGTLSDLGGVLFIFVIVLIGLAFEKDWMTSELKEEVAAGLIDAREYAMTCSYRQRIGAQLHAILNGNWSAARRWSRLSQALTELAFKKHQMRVRGQDYAREINRLRQEVAALRAAVG